MRMMLCKGSQYYYSNSRIEETEEKQTNKYVFSRNTTIVILEYKFMNQYIMN